ncbi:MAG: homoserine dehydrogenase, partial [Candidatus Marinamargulisbacteria bacterium]
LFEDQQDFETVLNEAKSLGFAEADPTADISGLDAAYKIVILTAVALKRDIQLEDIHYEGIDAIQLQDVQYLDELNYRVRLIAKAKQTPKGLFVAVYPTAIPSDHPLAMVRNEFNAIYSTGNMVGESMIYGKGAGSLPTGSAVMSDILDIAFDAHNHQSRRNLELNLATQTVLPITENHTSFYLRVSVNNKAGVLEALTAQFKTANISIQQMILITPIVDTSDIVLITEPTNESIFNTLTASLIASNAVIHIPAIIRVGL